jgi:hypothetical protein
MVKAAGTARARGVQLGLDAVLLKGLRGASKEASGFLEEVPPLVWVDSITGDVLVGQSAALSAERNRLNQRRAVEASSSEAAMLAPPAGWVPTPVAAAHTPSTSPPDRSSLAVRLSKRLSPSGAPPLAPQPLAPAAQAERRTEPGKGKVPARYEAREQRAAAPKMTHNKTSATPGPGTFVEGSLVDQMQHLEHEKPHGIKGVMYLMKPEF